MAKRRQWGQLKFATTEEVIRAVQVRAALEGATYAAVINRALTAYLAAEVAEVRARMAKDGQDATRAISARKSKPEEASL